MKKALIILLCLLLALPPSFAENAAADLQARFGGEAALTRNGTNYAVKKRISTLLFSAHEGDELLLAYLLVVDDSLDRIAAISIPVQTAIPAYGGQTLAQVYARQLSENDGISQAEQGSIALLDAVNSLLPQALVESRLALDCAGLALLDGGGNADPSLDRAGQIKARLKAIYHTAEGMTSGQQMDLFDALSAYLATDVKTGAMMKMADKAQRYDILPTIPLPGSIAPPEKEGEAESFIPDEDALLSLAVDYFYEESPW